MNKHLIRWTLILCLILAAAFLPVHAADPEPACSGEHTNWTAIASEEDWQANCAESSPMKLNAGKYYLTEDVTLAHGYQIASGVTLCLNGHTLSSAGESLGTSYLFNTQPVNNGTIIFCDHTGEGALVNKVPDVYLINLGWYGVVELHDLTIADGCGRYGALYVPAGKTLELYNTTITGNTGYHSSGDSYATGGVFVDGGTVRMFGGTISDNSNADVEVKSGAFCYFGGEVGKVSGAVSYPILADGAYLSVTDPDDITSPKGDGWAYDMAASSLTLTSVPASLLIDSAAQIDTVAATLDKDVTTDAFDVIPAGRKVSLDLNGHTLTGVAEEITVSGSFTVNDAKKTSGTLNTRVSVNASGVFTLEGGNITNTHSTPNWKAGGVYSNGTVVMNGGAVTGCTTTGNGGGVRIAGGSFTMNGGAIYGNTVGSSNNVGSGVNLTGGTFTMNGGTITGEAAYGGGVAAIGNGLTFTMTNGMITGCRAQGDTGRRGGSGVYMTGSDSSIVMTGGSISGNYSENVGGGVALAGGASMTLEGGEIARNNSDGNGGGVFVGSGCSFTMNSGSIVENNSLNAGGVVVEGGAFTLNGGVISANTAKSYAGAVCVRGGGSLSMTGGEITANTGNYGAVMMWTNGTDANASADISGGSITNNVSPASWAGGITQMVGTLNLSGTVVIRDNIRGELPVDVFVMGDGCIFNMSGGTVGNGTDDATLVFYSQDESHSLLGEITGGTVATLPSARILGSVTVNIMGGDLTGIKDLACFHVYGGNFALSDFLEDHLAVSGAYVAPSGNADYPYTVKMPEKVDVTGVTLDQETLSLTVGDAAVTLTATVAPADATNKNVIWTSSDGSVVTVANGVVTAVAEGTATVTATTEDGSFTATCAVTVNAAAPAGTPGDMDGNGKVNAKDIVVLQRFVAGGYDVALTVEQGDLDGNNKVNAKDIVVLQRFVAGGYDVTLG